MADTIFGKVIPPLKAIDNGDGTYSISVAIVAAAGVPVNTVFQTSIPPLKAVDLGDGTYAVSIYAV